MLNLLLNDKLPTAAVEAMRGHQLTNRHYVRMISASTAVYDKRGSVVAVLVKNVIPGDVANGSLQYLGTLRGDLTNRATVVRKHAQASRLRKDGMPSLRKTVPAEVIKAHGGKGDQLGFFDYQHARDCRETSWTNKNPEVIAGLGRLIALVNDVYRQTLPNHYVRQMARVNEIQEELKFSQTPFTTITVNLNNRTAAHTDKGDVRGGMGCMTTHGSFSGGYFIMPKYRIAFDVQPGDVLLADVHQLHGNDAMAGQRFSCVYYAREKMHLCARKEAA